MRKITTCFLTAAILFCAFIPQDFVSANKKIICTQNYSLAMWHYSGGYWKIGNDLKKTVKIYDKDIDSISGYLNANESIGLSMALPEEIKKAIANGLEVKVQISKSEKYDSKDISYSFTKEELNIYLKPKFIVSKDFHFDDYVPGLKVSIPLIDKANGQNVFSIFGNGENAAAASGMFLEEKPHSITSPWIHPSMIKDKTGALKSGYQIMLHNKTLPSGGYKIGGGTFVNAGAVGLVFTFDVTADFEIVPKADKNEETPTEKPEEPKGTVKEIHRKQ